MPRLSDTMQEGTIARWVKQEGEDVKTGDVLMEVETDKATLELNSYHDGKLARILIGDGGTAPVGTVVGILTRPGESAPRGRPRREQQRGGRPARRASRGPASGPAPSGPGSAGAPGPEAAAAPQPQPSQTAPARRRRPGAPAPAAPARSGPAQRRRRKRSRPPPWPGSWPRARGSTCGASPAGAAGPGGGSSARTWRPCSRRPRRRRRPPPRRPAPGPRTAPAAPAPGAPQPGPAPAPAGQDFEDRPLSRMRAGIARNIGLSKPGIPHIYLTTDVEVDALLALRKQLNEAIGDDAAGAHLGERPGAQGGRPGPARLPGPQRLVRHRASPPKVRVFRRINIGVAVSVEGGLLVPVLRDVDTTSLGALAREAKDAYERVKANKPRPDEYSGGTFTVSNLGQWGIDEFQAVINPPQAGILAVGAAAPKAVVRDGEVTVRTVMRVTISSDHRVVDGVYTAEFLQEFKRLIEAPFSLVI